MAAEVITLNITPTGDMPVLHLAQYDTNRPFGIALKWGEDDYTLPEGITCELQMRKTDSNLVTITPTGSSQNVLEFECTEQMCTCPGKNIAQLALLDESDNVIHTLRFEIEVQRDVMQGGLTSVSDIHNLTTQIQEIVDESMSEDYYTKTEVDDLIDSIPTFDPTNYYDKSDVDTLLSAKADSSSVYTKGETDTLLSAKADSSDVYTKGETDTLLSAKADAADVYTKAQVDSALGYKITEPLVFTPTGFPVDFYTVNNAADKCPLPVLKVNVASGDKSATLVSYKGTNMFGGVEFAKTFSGCSDYALNKVTHTVTFTHSPGITEDLLCYVSKMPFKANTQYTIMLGYEAAARNTSLRIFYTDNTSSYLDLIATTGKTSFRIVSTANKTIKYIAVGYWGAGLTTLYYDECGIFEGDVAATDFEPFVGNVATVDFNTTLDQSGVLDCISGLITLADTNTIQCDGIELDTYNGNNTIYASTGSITELKYYITGTEFFEYVRLIKG